MKTYNERREVARRLREVQAYVIPGAKTEVHPMYSGGRTTWEPTGEDLTRFVAIEKAIEAWNARHESPYRFPPNKQAAGLDAASQLDKVLEEADELADALHEGDADHACREAWDVAQAVEGILRRCPDHVVERARADVMLRCSRRGDYGEIADIE